MSVFTAAIYGVLANDAPLVALLAGYKAGPAIFTIAPVPGDAVPPYVVTAGEVASRPFDTKTSRGRAFMRDVKVYAKATGSASLVETIAERVRWLLHRRPLVIAGFDWVISDVSGPVALDEADYYGRALTLSVKATET